MTSTPNASSITKPASSGALSARERLLRRLAILIALLMLAVMGEVGLRVLTKVTTYIPKVDLYDAPHHYLGRALLPGASFESAAASIHVNSRGFRGAEFDVPKPEGTQRIFALGGSTTFGYYPATTADDTTYPAQLELLLNTRTDGARTEVVNAGVPGYSLRTSLQNYASRVALLEPDMIVVYHLTNDLARYGNVENLERPLMNQFVASPPWFPWLSWSYLYGELRYTLGERLLGAVGARLSSSGDGTRTEAGAWAADTRYLDVFRQDLLHLVTLAQRDGVRVVLATQAIAFRPETDFGALNDEERQMGFHKPAHFYATIPPTERYAMVERYNRIIAEVAAEQGTVFADVNAAIPRTPEYFWDYCHLTDKGSALQARIIFDAIVAAGSTP